MAKTKLGYAILCDMHGKVSGKDCTLGIFNRIFVREFPAVHAQCYLAFELWADPGEHELGLRIRNTDGEDVVPPVGPMKMQFQGEAGQGSGAVGFQNLPLTKPGIYSFEITVDGELIGMRELFVEPVPGAPMAPPPQQLPTD